MDFDEFFCVCHDLRDSDSDRREHRPISFEIETKTNNSSFKLAKFIEDSNTVTTLDAQRKQT